MQHQYCYGVEIPWTLADEQAAIRLYHHLCLSPLNIDKPVYLLLLDIHVIIHYGELVIFYVEGDSNKILQKLIFYTSIHSHFLLCRCSWRIYAFAKLIRRGKSLEWLRV